ncbi:SDR family NAD(P)-dependent oxidoreductase [Mycobacterium interjectum]|nr:SDR family NAD(P)-dependent oxidoreductase [Mycobacterium interjectum]
MELNGAVAVITGGASGIGRATALALARVGADVVVADIHQQRLDETVAAIGEIGQRALAVRCDVTSDADVDGLARAVLSEFGTVDVVMNNAGVALLGPPERVPMADWQRLFDINVFGVVRGIRAFVPILLEQGHGWIVNTASIAGLYAHGYDNIPYIGAKHAVVGITEGLYLYLRPKGIGVSVLCPELVTTNIGETARMIGIDDPRWVNFPPHLLSPIHPDDAAERVVAAIQQERYLILTHPENRDWVVNHGRDVEGFLADYLPMLYDGRDVGGLPVTPS